MASSDVRLESWAGSSGFYGKCNFTTEKSRRLIIASKSNDGRLWEVSWSGHHYGSAILCPTRDSLGKIPPSRMLTLEVILRYHAQEMSAKVFKEMRKNGFFLLISTDSVIII